MAAEEFIQLKSFYGNYCRKLCCVMIITWLMECYPWLWRSKDMDWLLPSN